MTSSTNFSCKVSALVIALAVLAGCAHIKVSGVSEGVLKGKNLKVAVFPIENMSMSPAPLKELRESLIKKLEEAGLAVIDEKSLQDFMAEHRVRYVGGIDEETAKAFKKEIGVDAVLMTELELYNVTTPPRISLISRLVSTGQSPKILWMDGTGLSGDESPGFLELGLIESPVILRENAVQALINSLAMTLSGREQPIGSFSKRFKPKLSFRSPVLSPGEKYTVAVLPFYNRSQRRYAGDMMELMFMDYLAKFKNLDVKDIGLIRQKLLQYRIILEQGLSLANADIIFNTLNVDLIVAGYVFDYEDYQGSLGVPRVDFSALILDRKSKEVVWSSNSYNEGNDGVFFFDSGKINTAFSLASEMTRAVTEMAVK